MFFPGVELRTDKGANNLHLILIFSELSDLETLSADFNAIMLRTLAKSKESDETIYWQFDDIVEFCKKSWRINFYSRREGNQMVLIKRFQMHYR